LIRRQCLFRVSDEYATLERRVDRGATESSWVEVDRQAVEETVCRLRGEHVGRKLSERVFDSSFARFDVTRILESTNDPRYGSERCSCFVAIRDDERTER
jgi:hypothetical protein